LVYEGDLAGIFFVKFFKLEGSRPGHHFYEAFLGRSQCRADGAVQRTLQLLRRGGSIAGSRPCRQLFCARARNFPQRKNVRAQRRKFLAQEPQAFDRNDGGRFGGGLR